MTQTLEEKRTVLKLRKNLAHFQKETKVQSFG